MAFYFNRQDVTEDDLRLLFSNAGGTVKAFKFFQYVDLSVCVVCWQDCFLWYLPLCHILQGSQNGSDPDVNSGGGYPGLD